MATPLHVILAQLPIPPIGTEGVKGNVPLAAGYLKFFAENAGLGDRARIDIFSPRLANTRGDRAIAKEIASKEPDLVGFTTYLWNIERSLFIAKLIKELSPRTKVVVGGPEVTADNDWVLAEPAVDFAVIGEGEQTFAELLAQLSSGASLNPLTPGLWIRGRSLTAPPFRAPLPSLDPISSPYLAGILDPADEQLLLLETIRGCIYKCKFCYYPKSYDDLYFLSREKLHANLRLAREKNVREVVLLDPTLNQRKDFPEFLAILAQENHAKQFTYFGELRAEGITPKIARLLKEANFTDVEVGLQTVDPHAQELMDRKNNMKAVERGIRAMRDEGINVKIDLIVGLPGDTPDTVRQGIDYLLDRGLDGDVQVFNLSVLPGTAFRQEAKALGLQYQSRPPYYCTRTETMSLEQMFELMAEAQSALQIEFDPLPMPAIRIPSEPGCIGGVSISLDDGPADITLPPRDERSHSFVTKFQGADFSDQVDRMRDVSKLLIRDNPHGSFQVSLMPTADLRTIDNDLLLALLDSFSESSSYLDRFYALLPGIDRPVGAKRLVIEVPESISQKLSTAERNQWLQNVLPLAEVMGSDGAPWELDAPLEMPAADASSHAG